LHTPGPEIHSGALVALEHKGTFIYEPGRSTASGEQVFCLEIQALISD
jgi:hypothetical protein